MGGGGIRMVLVQLFSLIMTIDLFSFSVNRDHGSMSFRNIDERKRIYKEIIACFFVSKELIVMKF